MKNKYIEEIRIDDMPESGSYPFSLPAVRHLAESGGLKLGSQVTFLCGENGTGKSTLIEAAACACGFNPEGGSKNFSFETADTVSELSEHITLSRAAFPEDGFFFRAESFYNAATYIDMIGVSRSYGGASLHGRSHGESFLALVKYRFRGKGLYILDEPEAALSPTSQTELLKYMKRLCENDSRFITATHSPILLAYPGAEIYEIRGDGIYSVSYDRCRTVRVYRSFLSDPAKELDYIFSEDDDDTL